MNPQAVRLYLDNGIDLTRDMLEIDVCAQHCNGGIAVDENWQSGVRGLYAAGEAAGTFGARRPAERPRTFKPRQESSTNPA